MKFSKENYRPHPKNKMMDLLASGQFEIGLMPERSSYIAYAKNLDQAYLQGIQDVCHSLNIEIAPEFLAKIK